MKKFRRSSERKIVGVCGGIGDYFDIDPNVVRVLVLILTIYFSFFMVLAYIVCAFLT